jgi:hypothetical protein
VALPRIGFNEGSLLRRTLLHVGTFVAGSMAFIGLVSFMLVSIARGIVSPRAEVADEEVSAIASAGAKPMVAPLSRPVAGRVAGKRGLTVPTPVPTKDD